MFFDDQENLIKERVEREVQERVENLGKTYLKQLEAENKVLIENLKDELES